LSYIVERLLLAYLLRYDQETDEWTLQSGFDGDELLSRPSIELVTVDSVIAKEAEQHIESCEHCHPGDAEIPFDWLLAEVIGKRGPYEFVLSEPARCPNCKHAITEKTLIEPKDSAAPQFHLIDVASLIGSVRRYR